MRQEEEEKEEGGRGRKRKEEVCWKQSAIIRQLGPTQNDKARAEAKRRKRGKGGQYENK